MVTSACTVFFLKVDIAAGIVGDRPRRRRWPTALPANGAAQVLTLFSLQLEAGRMRPGRSASAPAMPSASAEMRVML